MNHIKEANSGKSFEILISNSKHRLTSFDHKKLGKSLNKVIRLENTHTLAVCVCIYTGRNRLAILLHRRVRIPWQTSLFKIHKAARN